MLLGSLSEKTCDFGWCFGQSFLPSLCFLGYDGLCCWNVVLLGCWESLGGLKAENTGEAVNDDVTAVKDARESNVDAGDGDRGGGGGSAVGEVEAAVREERGESVAVGEEAELGEGEAERDDVETESVGVRRGR